jgi:hypothetical protein
MRPPVVESRRQAGVVEQHQCEQPACLRLLGGEREQPGEPDRLESQVRAVRMARRVDEVEHPQHDGEIAGLVQGEVSQSALGATDPLRHRCLRYVEGVGDLAGAEAADGTQRQRHLRGGRELRVATAEQQQEGVIARLGGARRRLGVRRLLTASSRDLAATGVHQAPGGDRDQPRARVARRVVGPHPQRLQQRVLQRVLGGVEVLAASDQAGEHLRDEGAQRTLVQPSRRLVDHRPISPRRAPRT